MRSPMNEIIAQQGNPVPQMTFQNSLPNPNQSHCSNDASSDQSTLKLTGSESPQSSPKHSPKQVHKKESKINNLTRDPSPLQPDKVESEQQDAASRSSDSLQPIELNRSISHDSNNKDRKESRGSDRSKKKSSWYNVFYSTYKSRSEQLKRYFKDLPSDERLIGDYSCALQREILVQGRLYVTQNYLCFYANIFRWEKCICIKWKDVSAVVKGKTAKVIPNAILISTESEKLFFTTFTTRDKAFMMLFRVWQNALMDQTMSSQEVWQWVHTAYGDELGLTSEDEDYNYIPPATNFDDKIYPIERLSADSLSEAFLANGTSSPLQMGVDTMPTDMSDNSSESDINPTIGEKIMTSCSSSHEGRHAISIILPINVDQLFTLMFTNSKFFFEFHTMRQSTDINASSWQQSSDSGEKIRTISMVVTVGQALAPKSANVQQTQVMLPCSVSGQLYSIDDEIVNNGIPYADSFYILMHYCLEKVSEKETSLNIYGQLKYKKSIWAFVKNIIEKTTWNSLKDHNEALVKALLAECEGGDKSKGRKVRRRHRAISNNPVRLPVDHLPSSTRSPTFNKGTRKKEEGRGNLVLGIIIAIVIILVVLNGLLYYKLWLLEDFTQISKHNYWHIDMELLKEQQPKNSDQWLEVLRIQENIRKLEIDKWQKVIHSTVGLLKKAEESLYELQKAIKLPNDEFVNKEEL
ncbi:conserved hypothetical protein [Pediculus humanus corporis]|uniref:VASt domain-containing protein n=1 Tax=Pediculus humanus subsp. corporis TaxID=121224 RepID=E0VWK6_PEDHC|nr:uncharacterized protein Phum_PHUM488310 [Pediculus humanus corporis]EEB17762.1 conserved hypothetical protein [Pediculus humanus corporis]